MPGLLEAFGTYLAYVMVVAGALWLVFMYLTAAVFLAWPAAACILGGALWKLRRDDRLSWAWVTAAAASGLLLAGYQALASVPLLSGISSTTAASSLVVFLLFAALHGLMLYTSNRPAPAAA